MDTAIKNGFIEKWEKYFPGNKLPIACFYSDELNDVEFPKMPKPKKDGVCIFSQLAPVQIGKARAFNQNNLGCYGASSTLGFIPLEINKELTDFLVYEEHLKKSIEHVKSMYDITPPMPAKGKYLIFKPWNLLTEDDEPEVVFFFSNADTIGGLHSLANFDTMHPNGVISPFGSGCDSLIGFAMKELQSDDPKAVLGLFDPSARVCVKPEFLNFSIPWPKFLTMYENMDSSILGTFYWGKIRKRMKSTS